MHFGLYAFDLFTVIYDEAWEIAHGPDAAAKSVETFAAFVTFAASFADKAAFLGEVPRLILERNLHGIDIDPRAAQIAGLSLWLRAHRAWQRAGVKPGDRPRITRSNLVCAEPMPGEKELLREFVERAFPPGERPAFAFLLERIFDYMTLAGEAGSLLRIEVEIRAAIAEASALAQRQSAPRQAALFAGTERPEHEEFNLRGLTDEQFWEKAEERIYEALETYAEQAENGGGFQRRLFANDAAQGFAFIDLCRKRYDVVVMNPPFGAASHRIKTWMRATYPLCGENILISFFCRVLSLLTERGFLGSIADRSWLQKYDYRKFRAWVIGEQRLSSVVDLGWEVLDAANVETAVSIFSNTSGQIIFGNDSSRNTDRLLFPFASLFIREPSFFSILPNRTFAYAIHPVVYSWFSRNCQVSGHLITFQGGVNSGDAFQTNRCYWEVAPCDIGLKSKWTLFQAGSPYAPFYYPTLMVSLCEEGSFKTLLSHPNARVPALEYYGRAGIAYGKRTDFMYSYVMPEGGAFSWEGQAGFVSGDKKTDLLQALGFTNSSTYIALANLVAGQHKYAGYLNMICCDTSRLPDVSMESEQIVRELMRLDVANELSLRFVSATANRLFDLSEGLAGRSKLARTLVESIRCQHRQISSVIADALGLESLFSDPPEFDPVELMFGSQLDEGLDWQTILSYALGVVYGRWDIRCATGARSLPELPDPFAPLPVSSPGMLQGADGLPLSLEEGRLLHAAGQYPLEVAWDGILVDDLEHSLDVERRVRAALQILWRGGSASSARGDQLEHEACALLGVKSLRDWFRKPAGFFAHHLRRYSKSNRQAPIYWPLSTTSGSYTLWLYYPRLTADTLFRALKQFVEPKLADVEKTLAQLRTALATDEAGTRERRQLEDFEALRRDLIELRTELELLAPKWKPNLNDGVLITAAPLWKLFRLPKWCKDLKACWRELERGTYDWSHLALTLWPDRVREKLRTDRSLAIAHGLEELCEVEAPKPKAKRRAKTDAAAQEREAKKKALREQLIDALSNILLGEKIPLDAMNVQTGEIIIPANSKITKTLLRKLASVYDHVDIAPSPIREKIREIIAQFEAKFAELEMAEQQEMAMEPQ
jgi:hypothetical protein